jgi:hypothetical protein
MLYIPLLLFLIEEEINKWNNGTYKKNQGVTGVPLPVPVRVLVSNLAKWRAKQA